MRAPIIAVAAVLAAGCSSFSSTPPRGSAPAPVAATASVSVVLTRDHIAMIRAYYGESSNARGQGRGRGQNGGLPPGIARNLERGKPLPPGIAKQTLPRDLVVRLPSLPSAYEYAIVAGKLVLIAVATQLVHDILVEALFS